MTKVVHNINWPSTEDHHAWLSVKQRQNMARAIKNPNENWMHNKLMKTGKKWSRQAIWGNRMFDFWCHELGAAVEVDGPEHDPEKDAARDLAYYLKSGIVIWRVPNGNEEAAAYALKGIAHAKTWHERRLKMGLSKINN